jgi:UTP--glucose-1-phosphate uridylyltransferase
MQTKRHTVRKAVFPVAGFGTRFLPVTKASPKEMLPVVDKPMIQYAVEEAAAAGITEMIFVTGRNKRAIEDHFDRAYELEKELEAAGKDDTLRELRNALPSGLTYSYVRQPEMRGLGDAVLCASSLVGDEPFAVILPDDIIDAEIPVMKQMVELYEQTRSSVVAVERVDPAEAHRYGVIKPESAAGGPVQRLADLIEKPKPGTAPSSLAIVGRYILSPAVFELLRMLAPRTESKELQLTDGIRGLLGLESVLGYEFEGVRYDCGTKIGHLQAQVWYALKRPELRDQFASYLRQLSWRPRQKAPAVHREEPARAWSKSANPLRVVSERD